MSEIAPRVSCARCRELERLLLIVADRIQAKQEADTRMVCLRADIREALVALGTPRDEVSDQGWGHG